MQDYTPRTAETVKWQEINERRYDEMLGILPPAVWAGVGFLVGEPVSHTNEGFATYAPFAKVGDRYFEGDGAMTRTEFRKLTGNMVLTNVKVEE